MGFPGGNGKAGNVLQIRRPWGPAEARLRGARGGRGGLGLLPCRDGVWEAADGGLLCRRGAMALLSPVLGSPLPPAWQTPARRALWKQASPRICRDPRRHGTLGVRVGRGHAGG